MVAWMYCIAVLEKERDQKQTEQDIIRPNREVEVCWTVVSSDRNNGVMHKMVIETGKAIVVVIQSVDKDNSTVFEDKKGWVAVASTA